MAKNQERGLGKEDNSRVNLSYQRVMNNHRVIDRINNPTMVSVQPRNSRNSSHSELQYPKEAEPMSMATDRCQNDTILIASACSRGTSSTPLDTGATKTVIGSGHGKELIEHFDPKIRCQLKRSKCQITFRFGNQATLQASTALVVPIGKLLLQIAVVPGGTLFLISNSLIGVLKCGIDVDKHAIRSPVLDQPIPLELTSKGLFLIDINQLALHAKIEGRTTVVYHVNEKVYRIPVYRRNSSENFQKVECHPPVNDTVFVIARCSIL